MNIQSNTPATSLEIADIFRDQAPVPATPIPHRTA